MDNPYEILMRKLDSIESLVTSIKDKAHPGPTRIPFIKFCEEQGITRPTAYAWESRGLIKTELIGGRRFVLSDSILVNAKYQREPQAA